MLNEQVTMCSHSYKGALVDDVELAWPHLPTYGARKLEDVSEIPSVTGGEH